VTVLEAKGLRGVRLPRVDLACDPGLHVVVAEEPQAGAELVEILGGIVRPQRGELRVLGKDPFRVPETRAAIATLLANEELPPGATVEESLGRALALHGVSAGTTARDLLADFGLSAEAPRSTAATSAATRRALSLALALSLRQASVLVLFEPFATALDRSRVSDLVAEKSRSATVVVVTASLREARALGGRIMRLAPGGLVQVTETPRLEPGALELVVSLDEPARLAESLASEPSLSGVSWERSPSELVLRGPDVEALCLSLFTACQKSGVRIRSVAHRAGGAS
jgi:ABC-type multidrug transport system ATPase subunit